jgi:hypothetical protein
LGDGPATRDDRLVAFPHGGSGDRFLHTAAAHWAAAAQGGFSMTFNSSSDRGTDRGRDYGRIGSDDDGTGIARTWMLIVGVALLGAGLLGFVDNPIVSQREDALFHVDTIHNVVHIVTGLVALFIGATLRGRTLAQATIAFGVAYLLVLVATLISPDLFGLFAMPVNTADHGLHLVLSVGSIAAGLASSRDRATA